MAKTKSDGNEIKLVKPYPKQQEILSNAKRNNLLILARRWGKTTLTGRVLKYEAVTKEKYRAAFSAPTWKLMMETFEEHRGTLFPAITRVNREDRRIELFNRSVIEFWSSDDTQAGRGRKYHIWVSDETQRQRNLSQFIRGSVRPTLADFRGALWVLGTANGEGSELHEFYLDCVQDDTWQVAHGSIEDNPYIHPDEIRQMRQDLGPELAAQELDSQWVRVDGITPLVRKSQWELLYGVEDNNYSQKILAVDASVSGDLTAIVGVWTRDNHYYINNEDIHLLYPSTDNGQIDYISLEERLVEMWLTGRYAAIAFDPYQMVSLAQRLHARGVRVHAFTQNSMRLKGDGFLRQVINEGRLHHPDHPDLTEHMLNATLKYSNDGSSFRIIKSQKAAKVDLAVATSMALWTLNELGAGNIAEYHYAISPGNRTQPELYLPTRDTPYNVPTTPWGEADRVRTAQAVYSLMMERK